jgi:uncharacterized protein
MAPTVTPIFIGILMVFQVIITNLVGYRRLKTGIRFLDGGDETLTRRMRAHGNFTETVPITLLGMLSAEMAGVAPVVIWIAGALLLVGRAWHYGVIVRQGWGNGRALSMVVTFSAMLLIACALVWHSI